MSQHHPGSYLRTHRKKSGISQRELASIVGYEHRSSVARHERAESAPPFLMALAYEAVFQVPVSELFPGFYQTVEHMAETRLAELESALQEKSARDRDAKATARKLQWMWERRTGVAI